jgi:HD-like signal output (HDOD) protein
MLAWLRDMFAGKPVASPPVRAVQAARAPAREKPRDEALWEALRKERGEFEPLAPEDEELAIKLVCDVVAYVCEEMPDPPVMPALAPRILDVVRESEMDVPKLVRVLEQDQAISAKLLSAANSAVFGPSKEITSLRDAIVYMGTEQTAHVAICLATRSLFDADARAELSMYRGRWSRLFHHGMTTAFAASNFSAQRQRRHSDEAFLGGLFHDVGRAVALRAISALTLAGKWDPPSEHVMDEVLYRIHATPGAEFYDRWTLPSHLMQICCDHHQLDNAENPSHDFHVVCLISSLDALRAGTLADKRYALEELRASVEQLKLSDAELRAAHTDTRLFAERVGRMLSV